ncbi:MAG: arginine--tRNA ligase, partial [Pseudomonadota bacterium]|nr:arginine--tRNA ligase [Pseudomonadota bacterium]
MKEKIKKIIIESAESCLEGFDISNLEFNVEISKGKDFGDFSTNLAMIYANRMKRSPQDVANSLTEILRRKKIFSKVAIAGPGFINLSLDFRFVNSFVSETLEKGSAYGSTKREAPLKVILEYVSANPTGPIHVGHGRGAVIGSSLAN